MKKWKVLSTNTKIASEEEVIEEIFKLRKISDLKKYLNADVKDLRIEDTEISLTELKKTIKRVNSAIEKKEKIIILGDYDVDGICASAILWETIYSKYKNVFPYIPDRFTEGYGISVKTIDNILQKYPDVKLIITVDNGIVANSPIDYAREKKIDVVITDHHVASEKLPNAYSIVHTTKLCGAGVAWILAKELAFESGRKIDEKLELAALATVTDLVPLTGLNRLILKSGLEYLQDTKRLGLNEIIKLAKVDKSKIGVYEIGHIIGPRLNAAGRVDHAIESLRLICSSDKKYVETTALLLENTNRVRQTMVFDSFQYAKLNLLTKDTSKKIIIVSHDSYSEGVIGLISSKLVENYYKPAVTISLRENISKGSARSIAGVNIVELLRSVSKSLIEVGGHPMAAGFSIKTDNLEDFSTALEKEAEKISDEVFERKLKIDMQIPIEIISESLYKKIQTISPFGMGNPEPIFILKNIKIENIRKLGQDGLHLKLSVRKNDKIIEAIGFGMGDIDIDDTKIVDLAFSIDVNEWRDRKTLQLKLKDIKFAKN